MADKVEYVTLSQERYDELIACRDKNTACRYPAVEEFRLWAQTLHSEVETVEDALRACTPDELYEAIHNMAGVYAGECSNLLANLIYALRCRLIDREAARAAEAAAAQEMERMMPDG